MRLERPERPPEQESRAAPASALTAPPPRTIAVRMQGLRRAPIVRVPAGDEPTLATVTAAVSAMLGLKQRGVPGARNTARSETGDVLAGIDLEIEAGSIVCLTGPKGAGKAALLRVLTGRLPLTEGRIEIRGAVASLLSAGENLEVERTGLQNVEREAQLIGVPEDRRADFARAAIAFAGLEEFAEAQVRRYSSGMRLRLSMAIALAAEADVLLLGDVLRVGDLAFQSRCIEALLALKEAGRTIILVSDEPAIVGRVADRVITLSAGRVAADRPAAALADDFALPRGRGLAWHVGESLPESDIVALEDVAVAASKSDAAEVEIVSRWRIKKAPLRFRPLIDVSRGKVRLLRSIFPGYIDCDVPQALSFAVKLPCSALPPATYDVDVSASALVGDTPHAAKAHAAVRLEVLGEADEARLAPPSRGYFRLDFDWTVSTLGEDAA